MLSRKKLPLWALLLLLFTHPLTAAEITTFKGSLEALAGPREEVEFLRHFPLIYYKKYHVEGLGSFYLDSRIDIIKNELRAGHLWEPEIIELLEAHIKPGTVAIDIGSHIGTHTLTMSKLVGKEGQVIAFEPQNKIFSELVMNMALNGCGNVTAYRCAVGDRRDTIQMGMPVADNEGGTRLGVGGDLAPMVTLDSLNLNNISLIKIDVENFEYQVLKGAEETLRRNMPYLILEIMGSVYEPIPDREEQVQRTLSFLKELGYQLNYISGSWSDWLATPPQKEEAEEDRAASIAIFAYKDLRMEPWDPDAVNRGVNGSEEAIIYMAEQLAELGYKVTVFSNPPKGSPHSKKEANPRYLDVAYNDGTRRFDIGISWRMGNAAKWIRPLCKKVYFWPHDTPYSPLTAEEVDGFDDVLWQSSWQQQQWRIFHPAFEKYQKIFGNGINPDRDRSIERRANPYSCIYCSNYARGLELLLDIWPAVKLRFPKAALDIYYGWQTWGLLSAEKELKMRKQVDVLASLDVKEHGRVGHAELNRALEQASFWTYPCSLPEVFCIGALRAQLAGAVPVIIEGSALSETVLHGYRCSSQGEYCDLLLKAMSEAEKLDIAEREKMGRFVLEKYTWETLAKRWQVLFNSKH